MKTTSRNWKQKSINSKKCLQILTRGLLLLSSLAIVSCSTTRKITPQEASKGEWEARVLVKNRKRSKTFIVNVDFIAAKPNNLRLDVTTPIGMHVASIAMNGDAMTYVIPQKKTYYEGKANAKALVKTLNFALDPKLIMNILFDQPIEGKGWTCKSVDNLVSECSQNSLKIKWANRKGEGKYVLVNHPQYQIQLKFHNFKIPSLIKDGTFKINYPPGFTKI